MNPVSMRHEADLKRKGFDLIAGVDEAGIGPLAGPVVAAAVILKDGIRINGLDDSKKLTAGHREELFSIIIGSSISIGIGIVDHSTIDKINILQASFRAMQAAVGTLSRIPDHILVDGIRKIPHISCPQKSVKKGDGKCVSIAAASIIAKVVRDSIMYNYDLIYPLYGFSRHKGYGTEEHLLMLRRYGPTSIHRTSYEPVSKCLNRKGFLFL